MQPRRRRSLLVVVWLCISLGLPLAASVHAQQAPQFSCGPHALTFLAIDRADDPTTGAPMGVQIRCAIVNPLAPPNHSPPIPKLIWYGEGWDFIATNSNHHLGFGLATSGESNLEGWAGDFSAGKTGRAQTFYGDITVSLVHGTWPAPTGIDVVTTDNQFHERWTLVTSVPYAPLPRPTTCAARSVSQFYRRYAASYPGHTGSGLRCVASIGKYLTGWFGNGIMDGASYTEIGYRTAAGYAAVDLCGQTFGTRCRAFSTTALKVSARPGPGKKRVSVISVAFTSASGNWTERWTQQ